MEEPLGDNVLLLGSYRQHDVYDTLEKSLATFGFKTFMLRDASDLAPQSNLEKLFAGIICSSFIVVVDDEPSGHIAELATLLSHPFRPVIIVRQSGRPATRFLEDSIALNDNFKIHDGPDLSPGALSSAIAWARNKMRAQVARLNQINDWRTKAD